MRCQVPTWQRLFFDRNGNIPRLEKRSDSAAKDQASRVRGSTPTGIFHHLKTVWIWEIWRIARCDRAIASSIHLIASWAAFGRCVTRAERILPYGAGGVPCFLNTASIAAWAHFSPSAPDTPIEPITSPSTTIGKAPGCGKSCMKVGARFWPLRTILFISEVGRRQRSADFAFRSAVSMELAARSFHGMRFNQIALRVTVGPASNSAGLGSPLVHGDGRLRSSGQAVRLTASLAAAHRVARQRD